MKHLVFSLFCLLLVSHASSQQKSIQFDKYTLEDGLSQSSITGIVQDNFGFIWIATEDGINRYDGYSFKTFKNEPNDTNSIPNNFIHSITLGPNGNIWFGTNRGIGNINPKNYKITRYKKGRLEDISGYIYTQIEFDKEGRLWVLSEKNGINMIDLNTNKVVNINKVKGNSEITSLFIDLNDRLWVGTQTGQVYFAEYPYNSFEDIDYNSIFTVARVNNFYHRRGSLLKILTEKGLFSIDDENRLQIVSDHIDIRYGNITSLHQENNHNLWIGTKDNGLFLATGKEFEHKEVAQYKKNLYDNSTISDNNITSIFEDHDGVFWIGTNKGVSKFDKYKQGFTTISLNNDPDKGLIDYNVWSFAEDNEGKTYIGTTKDLTIYSPRDNKFSHIIRDRNQSHYLLSIYVEYSDKIWLGYDDGLFLLKINDLEKNDYSFKQIEFVSEEIKRDVRVYAIVPTDTNSLWIGSRAGVTYMNRDNYDYTFYESNGDPNSPGSGSVKIVYQDLNNNTWIVSSNKGLYRIERSKIRGHNFIHFDIKNHNEANSHITCLLQTEKGTMWMGTYGEGIKLLDIVTGKTKNYTENDGLSNNVIYGLLEDENGNIWASTNKGISKFNPKTEEFSTFSAKDGLQSNEFNTNAYHKNDKGLLYFGGISGYNIFDPKDITINPNPPIPIISQIILSIKGVTNKEIIAENINDSEELLLEYDQNDLAFQFAATNYSDPDKNRFKYILEGHESEYTFLENENKVHYMNIPHGEYVFKLYARSADGIWSQEPTTVNITITPPFWLTWWFRILAALLLILFGFIFYRRRVDKIRRQKVRLEIEVVKRTRQVTEQSKKIQDQKQKVEVQKAKIEHQNELLEKEKRKS
jgi:ligand-binding sensor domain-containing protein